MVSKIPNYILQANIQDNTLRYEWDDWDHWNAYQTLDEILLERLRGISHRANVAFTISCAEWIVYRFIPVSDDPVPLQYLEAAWAAVVNWRYALYWEPRNEDWLGLVRRPLQVTINLVVDAICQADEGDEPANNSATISNLAEYLITNPSPFSEWRGQVLERLEQLYAFNKEDTLGEAVPREAFDTNVDFTPDKTERLITTFLTALDYRANPFLNSPEDMLEQGFEGTPYVFDIEKDRQERLEW